MNFNKFKELVNEFQDDIIYLYIYYLLTSEENLPEELINNETALEKLILLIRCTHLYGEQKFDLEFICEVAVSYVEEIFNDNLNEKDLDNLCSETFLIC